MLSFGIIIIIVVVSSKYAEVAQMHFCLNETQTRTHTHNHIGVFQGHPARVVISNNRKSICTFGPKVTCVHS